MTYDELEVLLEVKILRTEKRIIDILNLINTKVENLMAQIDDLTAALAQATTDTQKLIADVATQVAALQAALGAAGTPVDLTAAIAAANNIDALVTAADSATQPVTASARSK
jgi:hypothetical protein